MKYSNIIDEMESNPEMIELVNLEYFVYESTYSLASIIFHSLDKSLHVGKEYEIATSILQEILIFFLHLVDITVLSLLGYSKRITIMEKLLKFIAKHILEYMFATISNKTKIEDTKKEFFNLLCERQLKYSRALTLDSLRDMLSESLCEALKNIKLKIELENFYQIFISKSFLSAYLGWHKYKLFKLLRRMENNSWLEIERDTSIVECPHCEQKLKILVDDNTLAIQCPNCYVKFIYWGKNSNRTFLIFKEELEMVSPAIINNAFYLGHFVASVSFKDCTKPVTYDEIAIKYIQKSINNVFINMGIKNTENIIEEIGELFHNINEDSDSDSDTRKPLEDKLFLLILNYLKTTFHNSLIDMAYQLGVNIGRKISEKLYNYFSGDLWRIIEYIQKLGSMDYSMNYLELLNNYLDNTKIIKEILISDYTPLELIYEYSKSLGNIQPHIMQSELLAIALNEIYTDKKIKSFLEDNEISLDDIYIMDMTFFPFDVDDYCENLIYTKNGKKFFIYIDINKIILWSKSLQINSNFDNLIISRIKWIFVHECLYIILRKKFRFPRIVCREEISFLKKWYNQVASVIETSIIHPLIIRLQREYNLWFLDNNIPLEYPTMFERLKNRWVGMTDLQEAIIQDLLYRSNLRYLTPGKAKRLCKKIIKYLGLEQYLKVIR